MNWSDYKQKKLENPKFKQAYDELETEYLIMNEILKAREEFGMSQNQLSEKTGIAQSDIIKLEKGMANPSVSTLRKLAGAFGKKLQIEFV